MSFCDNQTSRQLERANCKFTWEGKDIKLVPTRGGEASGSSEGAAAKQREAVHSDDSPNHQPKIGPLAGVIFRKPS